MINLFSNYKLFYSKYKNVILYSFGTIILAIVQLVVIAVLSRLLNKYDFGTFAILQMIIGFVLIFSQFGTSQVIIQKKTISKKIVSNIQMVTFSLGILSSIICLFLSFSIASFFDNTLLLTGIMWILPLFIFKSLSSISESLVIRHHKFVLLTKIQIISYVFGYGLFSIMFAFLNFGYLSIIYGLYAQTIISSLFYLRYYPFRLGTFPKLETIKVILKDGGGYFSVSVMNYFTEEIDNFIVAKKMNTISLGVYNRAFNIFSITTRLFTIVYDKIAFPYLSKRQNNLIYLRQNFLFSNNLSFIFLTPLSLIICIFSDFIVITFLGDQWSDVSEPLFFLSLAIPVRFGFKISKNMLKSINKNYISLKYYFLFLIVLCSLLFVASDYSLKYVSIAVLAASIINYIIFYLLVTRLLGELNYPKKEFLNYITLLWPLVIITVFDVNNSFKSLCIFGLTTVIYLIHVIIVLKKNLKI